MTDVREATASLLEEKPPLESALQELLEVDQEGTWTFQDVSLDSGTFGEIVSTGIVEKADGEYRLVDREAVRAALNGEVGNSGTTEDSGFDAVGVVEQFTSRVDRNAALLLFGGLLLVALFRMISFPSVFRNGDVVLLGNDPYYYRYWVEQVAASAGVFDFSGLSTLPESVKKGEPLLVATLWFVSSLLGGSTDVIGVVVALYPVVSAVVVGVFVYLTAKSVSNDRRVGLAAVLMLALIPAHAYRSGLGFADHHAFDYLWLSVTALALVELVSDSDQKWFFSGLLGFGVAGQILAWDNGPLLVIPLAFVSTLYAADLVHQDRAPLREGVPLVVGLALASALVWIAHTTLGWHSTVVASVPALVTVGTLVVLGLGEGARRSGLSVRLLLGSEVVGGLALAAVLPTMFPELSQGLIRGVDRLFGAQNIVETTSLVGQQMGSILGPLLLLGFIFVLGLPYIVWATVRVTRGRDIQWLALSVYAWWFFALALVQLRFAGEFSVFLAVFAGLGFVHVGSVVGFVGPVTLLNGEPDRRQVRDSTSSTEEDKIELEMPSRREAVTYFGFTAFIGSLSFVQIPVKFNQLVTDEVEYQTADWMRDYAREQGWSYPQNYVFSEWGKSRMYNSFVSGEAASYGFAKNNFVDFLRSTDPESWYERLKGRVGFVVFGGDVSGEIIAAQLSNYGSETEEAAALSHYRAVHTEGPLRVFTLVPGATIVGEVESDTVTVTTDVEVSETSFTYQNTVQTDSDGTFSVTVPHAGEYQVGGETYVVSEKSVTIGEKVRPQQ